MERWITAWGEPGRFGEVPEVDAFLEEVLDVCRRHGMSIGHEDHHGSFVVQMFTEEDAVWLRGARDERRGR